MHKIHVIVFVIIGFVVGWLCFLVLQSPLNSLKEVKIREGRGVYAIANDLKQEGVIGSKLAFVIYTLITGNEKKLQAGRYVFEPGATVPSVVYSIARGDAESDDILLTIPEGFNVFDIDMRLTLLGLIQEGEFAKKYHTNEGQFSPDTYRFKKEGETVDTIAEKIKSHFMFLPDTLLKASILEKEAKTEEDMRLVAGVIENRLKRGMLLQIDATVSYGVCLRQSLANNFSKYCDVSQIPIGAEIKIDGPYNTYTRAGLPPGPIANPGIIAVQAVLNPQKSNYLFYLSTRDGNQLIFSKTAAEHAANRRKYLGL